MKRSSLVILPAILAITTLSAQTITSTSNGNWAMPTTWDCTCIPGFTADVIVAHDVTLNTDWQVTGGSITINAGASLLDDATGRDLWMNGGSLTNNGTLDLRYLLLSSNTFTNTGTFYVESFANFATINNSGSMLNIDSLYTDGTLTNNSLIQVGTFYNDDILNNYGSIFGLDSMTNAGTLLNDNVASITADSATNIGTFTNNGAVIYTEFTNIGAFSNNNYLSFYEFTNLGIFTNSDSVVGTASMVNLEDFNNQANAVLLLGESMLNYDPTFNDAVFTNNGYVDVGDSWYNFNTTQGTSTGWFIVADTSYNSGSMTGSFDFCDLTPPGSPPYVDYNLGTINLTITWCTATDIDEQLSENIQMYPNPVIDVLTVSPFSNNTIKIFNLLGELVITSKESSIDVSALESGVYAVTVLNDKQQLITSQKLVKD